MLSAESFPIQLPSQFAAEMALFSLFPALQLPSVNNLFGLHLDTHSHVNWAGFVPRVVCRKCLSSVSLSQVVTVVYHIYSLICRLPCAKPACYAVIAETHHGCSATMRALNSSAPC